MSTTYPSSLLLVLCASVSVALAQATSPTPSEETAQEAPKKRQRAISGEASAALSAGYSYQPQKPVEVSEDEEIDQRDVDKPRNQIIRLPKYMVEAQRPPVFRERDFYSNSAELRQLMLNKYFGQGLLNQKQLGKTGAMYAAQSFWDDQRLKGMMEMNQQASIYRVAGDDDRAKEAAEDAQSTYLRVNDAQSAELSKQAGQRY